MKVSPSTLAVLAALLSPISAAVTKKLGIKKVNGKFELGENLQGPVVNAEYTLNKNDAGWNYLEVFFEGSNELTALSAEEYSESMKAAGILEGYMTCKELNDFYSNFYAEMFGDEEPSDDIVNFLQTNYEWAKSQSDSLASTSDFWMNIKGTLSQLSGIVEGFTQSSCYSPSGGNTVDYTNIQDIKLIHLLFLNAFGDLYTIQTKYLLENMDGQTLASRKEGFRTGRLKYPHVTIDKDLRCSALFKLLPDYSDIMFGHTTWDSFMSLYPRIFKHYRLPSMKSDSQMVLRDVYFSASPGLLSSVDDFYTVHESIGDSRTAQLAVIETTNEVFNPDLFELVVPESVLSWMRAIAANQVATTGAQWSQLFSIDHSGTYTNQWMILDMNLFVPGSSYKSGLFTVCEEIPGLIHYEDMTSTLYSNGFWPSYNIPYFEDVYSESGNKLVCHMGMKMNNTDFCYDTCPRANIFRDRQDTIMTMDDFKYMINYNDWENDPLSEGDACDAIACRRDLESDVSSRYPAGGLDGKASSVLSATSQSSPIIHARLGPTNDDQPYFCWSQLKQTYVHVGHPDCFNFDWTNISS